MVLKFCHTLNDLGSFYKTRFLDHTIPIKPESLEVRTRHSYFSRRSRAFQGQPSLRKQMSKVKAIRSPSPHTAACLSTDTRDPPHTWTELGSQTVFLGASHLIPQKYSTKTYFAEEITWLAQGQAPKESVHSNPQTGPKVQDPVPLWTNRNRTRKVKSGQRSLILKKKKFITGT